MKKAIYSISLFFLLFSSSVFSFEFKDPVKEECIARNLRADNIPDDSIVDASDPYFEGYLQALVDMHFYEFRVIVLVQDGTVWLANVPKNKLFANSIISFLKDVPGVKEVKKINGLTPKEVEDREKYVHRPRICGIWFPQTTSLFQPMIANPRQVRYSIGYRSGDRVMGKMAVAIALGDDFPIYRWLDVGSRHGDVQIGIETGIWSVFDIKPVPTIVDGTALMNTDFYVGIPIVYAVNKWAHRFRIYHISSHLGDEFMVNQARFNPSFQRVNPSFEAFDYFFSYQANDAFRGYAGAGLILHSDKTYPMKHYYFEYGGEARFWGKKIYYHKLYGTWVTGAYFRHWQRNDLKFDVTAVAGYEWSKIQGVGRKIRILADFHHGYSCEGQFFRDETTYVGIGLVYGF